MAALTQRERLIFLIEYLLAERNEKAELPKDESRLFKLYRALVNVREPGEASAEFLRIEDEFLSEYLRLAGITDSTALLRCAANERISIWRGDITRLKIDGIVNAANSALLGCFAPNHDCIDNCIHTFAGIRLRLECSKIMLAQGAPEPTGTAKITPAFNLPSKYVLHTVGPIIYDRVTPEDCRLLASCYQSCFALADEMGLESLAFCCISTGVFRFPNDIAADIAVTAVQEYLCRARNLKHVVFDVFNDSDFELYKTILG